MALYFRIHLLSLYFLFIMNLAYSYVMLTANVEDVKKLARKFLSESLAEQIGNFVAQIKGTQNVSEENERNLELQGQSSKEDSFQNDIQISQNPSYKNSEYLHSKTTKSHRAEYKDKEGDNSGKRQNGIVSRPNNNNISPNNQERNPKKNDHWGKNNNFRPRNRRRPKYKRRQPNKKGFKKSKPQKKKQKQRKENEQRLEYQTHHKVHNANSPFEKYDQTPKRHLDTSEIGNAPNNYNQNDPKRERKDNRNSNENSAKLPSFADITSTVGHTGELKSDKSLNPNQHRFEVNSRVNKAHDNNQTSTNYAQYAGYNIPRNELTTEKERNEFDQYDNTNYPKSEFVATSGPVSLPKVPSQADWSEKDLSDMKESYNKIRKAWF